MSFKQKLTVFFCVLSVLAFSIMPYIKKMNADSTQVYHKSSVDSISFENGTTTYIFNVEGVGSYFYLSLNVLGNSTSSYDSNNITIKSVVNAQGLTEETLIKDIQQQQIQTVTGTPPRALTKITMLCSANYRFDTDKITVVCTNTTNPIGYNLGSYDLYNSWVQLDYADGSTNVEQYNKGYSVGYDYGLLIGKQTGSNEALSYQGVMAMTFNGMANFLNVEIFPNITLGMMLGLPIVLSVFAIVMKMFKEAS